MKFRFLTVVLIVVVMAGLAPVISTAASTPELVNGGFETGTPGTVGTTGSTTAVTGWTITYAVSGCPQIAGQSGDGIVRSGNQSLKMTKPASTASQLSMMQKLTGLEAGKSYRVTGWVYLATYINGFATRIFAGNTNIESPTYVTNGMVSRTLYFLDEADRGKWIPVSLKFEASGTLGNYVGIMAEVQNGATVYWDDITIEEVGGSVENGGFEYDAAGTTASTTTTESRQNISDWFAAQAGGVTVSVSNEKVRGEEKSLCFSRDAGTTQPATIVQEISGLAPGKRYRVSGYMRFEKTDVANSNITRIFGGSLPPDTAASAITTTASPAFLGLSKSADYNLKSNPVPAEGVWIKMNADFIAEPDKKHYVGISASIADNEVFWDDITITEIADIEVINGVTNGGFEADEIGTQGSAVGWTVSQNQSSGISIAISDDEFYAGSKSIMFTNPATLTGRTVTLVQEVTGLTPGQRYCVSGRMWYEKNDTPLSCVTQVFGGASTEQISDITTDTSTNEVGGSPGLSRSTHNLDAANIQGWKRLRAEFTAEEGESHYIGITARILDNTIFWDDIKLEEAAEVRGLLNNGDFEDVTELPTTGLNQWKKVGTITAGETLITDCTTDGLSPYEGESCLRIGGCTTSNAYVAYDITGLEPDVDYKLSLKVRSLSGTPTLVLSANNDATINSEFMRERWSGSVTTAWRQITIYFSVTEGTSDTARRLRLYTPNTSVVFVDDVILEKAAEKIGYRDALGFDIDETELDSEVTAYVYIPNGYESSDLTLFTALYTAGNRVVGMEAVKTPPGSEYTSAITASGEYIKSFLWNDRLNPVEEASLIIK